MNDNNDGLLFKLKLKEHQLDFEVKFVDIQVLFLIDIIILSTNWGYITLYILYKIQQPHSEEKWKKELQVAFTLKLILVTALFLSEIIALSTNFKTALID